MPEAQDQVALPAWLESLRAGERSAAPVNNTPPFSAPNFVEEGSLPSWMRPERGEGSGNTDANPIVSAYPGQAAGQEITSQSLVDENALPAWLREGKIAPAQSSPAQPIQASSLVEQEDVPEWMKTLQPQSSTSFPSERRLEPKPVAPSQPLSGMSAHDLIDPQAVPDWMKAQANQGNPSTPRGMVQDMVVGGQQSTQAAQSNTGQSMPDQMAGFSAASLLDENALPQWLRESGANARQSNQSAAGSAGNGWGSVPSPSYPAAASNAGMYTPPMQDNSWSAQVPPQTPVGSATQQSQGMPASSFIDEDALPPWLRAADQQQGASSGTAYGSQGGSPMGSQVRQAPIAPRHVDNVRVPNRPRNESSFSDTSESAANVFASMLGVASAAPNYLGQQMSTPQPSSAQAPAPGQGASYYGQDYRVAQGNASFSGNQPGNASFNGVNVGNNAAPNTPMGGMAQGYGANSAMSGNLNSANVGSGYAAAQPGWNGNGQQVGGQRMGGGMAPQPQMVGVANPNAANVPNAMNNYGAPSSSAQMADQSGDQKGKKRGLFGAFLDWLSR